MPTLRLTLLLFATFLVTVSGCRSSKTAKKIASFADAVCQCTDAECAKEVQENYLTWWKDHQRARGSEEDRKEVEGSMERFASCYQKLVGEEKSTLVPVVPSVDLTPPSETKTDDTSPVELPDGAQVEGEPKSLPPKVIEKNEGVKAQPPSSE